MCIRDRYNKTFKNHLGRKDSTMTYVTNSPAETEALGQRLAETLQPGDVILSLIHIC